MPLVVAYHRPETVDAALALLGADNRVVLAGGTTVNADRAPSSLEAVDLQALELTEIEQDGDHRLRIGAMATLDDVSRSDLVPDRLRAVAQAEQPSTLRTLATIGGVVAGRDGDSLLLAALLAHDAQVELAGADHMSLPNFGRDGLPAASIITAVSIDTSGHTAEARTGRTPADVPIVAAYGRQVDGSTTIALTGVADQPVLVDGADPTRGLEPPADFRGSSEYRVELARVLTRRVREELG